MKLPDIGHWLHVATRFHPLQREFWLGLLHDAVEDGFAPRALLRWPALDAITRRPGEEYAAYIQRLSANDCARRVKLADLAHNLARNGGPGRSLAARYRRAQTALEVSR